MKVWAYVALGALLIAGVGGAWRVAYSSGYNARDLLVQQEIIAAQEAARIDEARHWAETIASAEATVVIEERIVEVIREVEKEVPIVVTKIITEKPECADLGADFQRLLNNQVRASNGGESAEAPVGVVEGVL